jgi:hypothetical protein
VVLAHRVIELASVAAVELTELRILVTLGMLFFVLLPQKIQGEIEFLVGLKLLVDILKVRQRFGWCFERERRGKKFLLQFVFA